MIKNYFCECLHNSKYIDYVIFFQVKIWFQNRRMKWRNSKERELLSTGGSRDNTLPNKNNPNPDLSDPAAVNPSDSEEPSEGEYSPAIGADGPQTARSASPYPQLSVNSQEIFRQMDGMDDDLESVSDSDEEEINVS